MKRCPECGEKLDGATECRECDWSEYQDEDVRDVGNTLDAAVDLTTRMHRELAAKDARIASLTEELERVKKLLASLPKAARTVGMPGPGGINICGGIPSEIYVAIGRDRYDDEYEVAAATAEAMREGTASYLERLIKEAPQ